MSEILTLLTEEHAKRVAEDIVVALEEDATKDTLNFDFETAQGKMIRKPVPNEEVRNVLKQIHGFDVPAPNTWFSFDTKKNSMLGFLKDSICKEMEEDKLTEKEFVAIQDFIAKLISVLNTEEALVNRIKAVLRKLVLNNAEADFFPIEECRTILFEFGEKSDYGDIIKIFKYARVVKATGEFIGETTVVSKDLMRRREKIGYKRGDDTKAIYTQIALEQRAAGNPLYRDVFPEDIKVVQEAKECHLEIFAEYSPISREEILARCGQENSDKPLE